MLNDRSPHSAGYESFSSLHGRAARWIYTQNNTRLINLQTLPVKVKKEDTHGRLIRKIKELVLFSGWKLFTDETLGSFNGVLGWENFTHVNHSLVKMTKFFEVLCWHVFLFCISRETSKHIHVGNICFQGAWGQENWLFTHPKDCHPSVFETYWTRVTDIQTDN